MTTQIRESLTYRGRDRMIRAYPLTGCDRPVPDTAGISTGCYRGYRGTWEVWDDALHLVRITGPFSDGPEFLGEMFPDHTGPVPAAWFSGEIVPDDCHPDAHPDLPPADRPPWFALVVHRGRVLVEEWAEPGRGVRARLTEAVGSLFPADEAAFLRAVTADRDDVLPKLVYADWLDERGDPRGPLLRAAAERQRDHGPRRREPEPSWLWPDPDVPTGFVPPDDILWYWRWLADMPEPTREERERAERLKRLRDLFPDLR